jgi:hypothetical protein
LLLDILVIGIKLFIINSWVNLPPVDVSARAGTLECFRGLLIAVLRSNDCKMTKKRAKKLAKIIGGTLAGACIGLIINRLASGNGSQCMIVCQTPVAMAYFGLVGLLLSMK